MRTRLDEIVESFFGTDEKPVFYPDGARKAVMAAMNASFRYGVERSIASLSVISGHKFDCENKSYLELIQMGAEAAREQIRTVQPAPAEEKRCDRGIFACCGGRNGHTGPCQPDPDRRNGERRKGLEKQQVNDRDRHGYLVGIYQIESNLFWFDDRRSGKDRRRG